MAQSEESAPSALDVIDDERFLVLAEAAELACHHARHARHAALNHDRSRARLNVCQASRAIRSALVTLEELCRRRA
jgi:hypothetical protein